MSVGSEENIPIADDMYDEMAKEYEEGTWSGHGEITRGRPKLYDEDLETISFRLPKSRIAAIDAITKQRGEARSTFLREAVDEKLLRT